MDNTQTVAVILGVALGVAVAGWLTAFVLEAGRSHRSAMSTLSDLFKQHTKSLENLKAIESSPDGMRGVVARDRPAPSLLEDPPEVKAPSVSDMSEITGFVEVGHAGPLES